MEIQPETWRGNIIGISNVAAKMIFSLIKAKRSLLLAFSFLCNGYTDVPQDSKGACKYGA